MPNVEVWRGDYGKVFRMRAHRDAVAFTTSIRQLISTRFVRQHVYRFLLVQDLPNDPADFFAQIEEKKEAIALKMAFDGQLSSFIT